MRSFFVPVNRPRNFACRQIVADARFKYILRLMSFAGPLAVEAARPRIILAAREHGFLTTNLDVDVWRPLDLVALHNGAHSRLKLLHPVTESHVRLPRLHRPSS